MIRYSELNDEELIRLSQEGSSEAAEFLMDRYKPLVRRRAKSLYMAGGDKDDLIQEGMIGLYKAIRGYQMGKSASFLTFAELCISRQMYSAIKLSNTKKNQPLNFYVSFDAPQDVSEGGSGRTLLDDTLFQNSINNPDEQLIVRENVKGLEEKLDKSLSVFENEVLHFHLRGLSYMEIASRLGKEPKVIDNALQRVKRKLISILCAQTK